MHTLATMNQKGGSGKTTTAVNLGAALAEHGQKVLVIDLDPQASASAWMGVPDGGKGLYDVFTANGNLSDYIVNTAFDNLAVIPASAWLVGVERAMAGEVGGELVFRSALNALPPSWDWVIVDCPPSLGFLSVSALAAVQHVVVPVETHIMAVAGLAALLKTISRVQERLNQPLKLSAILPCRVDFRKNLSKDVVSRLRERFGDQVMKSMVRENVRLAEAPSFAQPITVYDPRSAGAEDYRAVATELAARLGGRKGSVSKKKVLAGKGAAR